MNWTLEQIIAKLSDIKRKDFIPVPEDMYRVDDGVVGQILEREFNIIENNVSVSDLGDFELKGMREKSGTLTLCHRKPEQGLTPIEIFNRFGYVKASNRDKSVLKKKLFCTVTGTKVNRLGLILRPFGQNSIDMYYHDEFICRWNLGEALAKINRLILVLAKTDGKTGAKGERFYYAQAYLLDGLKNLDRLVDTGSIVIDFCIDQNLADTKGPHDRGPHIRMPKSKLLTSYIRPRALIY